MPSDQFNRSGATDPLGELTGGLQLAERGVGGRERQSGAASVSVSGFAVAPLDLRSEPDGGGEVFVGRIEHVVSGEVRRVASASFVGAAALV